LRPNEEILAFVDQQDAKLEGVGLRADWERERTAQF
jgi:hypothetical protein